ncbi:MAG: hypothetical protein K1X89_23745 [Myxococcaceae bacterium]|nr:hypothetical protein [Myxococcaceae bacterium]
MALSLALGVLALAAAPVKAAPESKLLLTSEAVERVVLTGQPTGVSVDPWAAEVTVRFSTGSGSLPRNHLCPRAERRGNTLVLGCTTHRLSARLESSPRGPVLELRALRGLPPDDGLLRFHYEPTRFGLGAACPGDTPASQAECLLAEGKPTQARPLLEAATTGPTAAYAQVRLGDLSAVAGDPVGALAHYQAAGLKEFFGRLARLRICELSGCEELRPVYDAVALPEPLATEVELRRARAYALLGREEEAAVGLQKRLRESRRPPPCQTWPAVCAGVALAALRSGDEVIRGEGLSLFVLEQQAGLEKNLTVARQAADAAATLGAHRFAANLLASVSNLVPASELEPHLARLLAEYLACGDGVRAAVIREYAAEHLHRALPPGRPAAAADDAPFELPPQVRALVTDAEQDLEVANATEVLSRASALSGPPSP